MSNNSIHHLKADILVVDDTPNNIRLLSKMLIEQGYNVRKALNGQMALVAIQTTLPDLILLDINMPEMSGYEVCEQIKKNPRTSAIPIIFLSALDDAMDKVKAFQAGAADYITKPFYLEEVLARIQNQLTIKRLQTQLQDRNKELQQALTDLKTAQAQLVQKEKMIALGQMVAGIAHEINNPISFIAGNLAPARSYIQAMLYLINQYQQEYPNPTPAIRAAVAAVDLDFLSLDLPKLLNSIQVGVERIRTIILALRIFSRLDEAAIKCVDIHQGIDSTLLLLEHRLQQRNPSINIVKNYGRIPSIVCYASQLNQVFLNLLTNAIEALEQVETHPFQETQPSDAENYQPTIWITTALTAENNVQIRIKDNGPGITEAAQSRLFDPFFTTKPVGEGKGLGLAVSYEIVVEKHQGQLTCQSSPGQGAEFVIEVPADASRAVESDTLKLKISS
jgi:signal transduction histidine kinase